MPEDTLKQSGTSRYGPTPSVDPGAAPATLRAAIGLSSPTVRIIAYSPDVLREEVLEDVAQIKDWLEKWPVLWVQVTGLGDIETIEEIGRIFDLHPLALEDVVNLGHRPKIEEYDNNLFIVLQIATWEVNLGIEQLNIFLGHTFLVTFQETPTECLKPIIDRLHKKKGRIRRAGADYLAYAIIDSVVDHFFPILEQYSEHLESLEDRVISNPDPDLISQIHGIKHDLLALRRTLWPLREITRDIMDDETGLVADQTRPFLRDCYDHTIQAMDLIEIYREVGASLSDIFLSSLSNRMNEVMKVLTIIATIFIPLTFLAGIYGMNFNPDKSPWNMPELSWYWGYPFILILMAVIASLMLVYFRKRKWL